jgi:hypothetical protein
VTFTNAFAIGGHYTIADEIAADPLGNLPRYDKVRELIQQA